MLDLGPVSISGGIISYNGNNYPASRVDSINIDHSQKTKSAIGSGISWILGFLYAVDFYGSGKQFSLLAAGVFFMFAVWLLIITLSQKTILKMKTAGRSVVIKAPTRAASEQIRDAISKEIVESGRR
ncbi:hypothetical protein Amal_01726 [Acetobacter malorum]|uniref:Uncharacterized protein n=1 Tax=Acetobacter malorum TaxID=178901 RepID=A0A177G808_9PROT|nr:hypothetical protein [Acetobacter malorum]OAG75956.1 hypothetical protein Amal_01726 [Acetobacter malorum]